ncbi:MAG: ABC transporter substrate-binding protein [Eubacterium sp.]|nr:ABC transporter substrate-binding protein [Eubacterium sp.]
MWRRKNSRISRKMCCFLLAAAAIACLMSSCGSRQPAEQAAGTQTDYEISVAANQELLWDYTDPSLIQEAAGAHVAVVAKEMDLEYWKAVREGAEQAVDDLNELCGYEGDDKVVLTFEGPGGGTDVEAQINQIDAVLAENPSVLCIAAVDMASCEPQLEAALDNGIPVLALDSGVESPLLTATCATDNYAAAIEATAKLCEAIGDAGEIALVSHSSTSQTAIDRVNGFTWEIAIHQQVKVAANLVQNTSETMETMLMAALELHPDLKGIFCTNEQMAAEVLDTLKKADRQDLVVVGFDAGEVQREAVEEGRELGLICQNPRGMGYVSVTAALHAASGDHIDKHIDTGFRWIDKDNMDLAGSRTFLY